MLFFSPVRLKNSVKGQGSWGSMGGPELSKEK